MLIRAEGLSKVYGGGENKVTALHRANLQIAEGGFHLDHGTVRQRQEHLAAPVVRSGFSHGGKTVLRWKGHIWIE